MTFRTGHQFLHTPGPTPIPECVLNAMHRQPLDLSDPVLVAEVDACFAGLKSVFRTSGEVYIYAANGHGGWEAALTNLFAPNDRVLIPETGHFSMTWADHARALGVEVQTIAGDGRHAVDPAAIEAALRADGKGKISAVLVIQTDTAAGVTSDIQAVRGAIDAAGHPALLVVDAVASLGAAPFDMDGWGVDVTIAASQKALMGPPGLALVAVNQRARAVASAASRHRRYWDWEFRSAAEGYRKFCGTTPEQHIFALKAGLDLMFEEGLDRILARHKRLAGAVQAAVAAWSEAGALSFNALVPEQRSVSVTTILTPPDFPSERVREYARSHCGVALGGGLGPLSGKAFRIGHLGSMNEPTILGCLGGVELALSELGIAHGTRGLRAAVEHLTRTGGAVGAVPVEKAPAAVGG